MVKQEKVRSKNSATSTQSNEEQGDVQNNEPEPEAQLKKGGEEMAAHIHTHNILTRQR